MALLELGDGRQVHYETSGPVAAGQTALVFHHGQPGSAGLWDGMTEAAAAHGMSVIALSRPGYGYSDRRAGRSVADVVGDVTAVIDHLGVERFVTAGWSGGGPHALACGALMAPRCAAVATIAGVAPYFGVDDLDFTAGMGPENVDEFEGLIAGDPSVEPLVNLIMSELRSIQADQLVDAFGGLVSQPDKDVLVGPFAEFVAGWMRLAAASGHFGYWDDGQAFVSDWGFDWAAMSVPVRVWRAGQDLMVPPSHGEWLASHVTGAKGVLFADEGHISLFSRHIGEIVAGLVEDAGEAQDR
jgi:pimeloyl-ACP methyl ester carboxylesterase